MERQCDLQPFSCRISTHVCCEWAYCRRSVLLSTVLALSCRTCTPQSRRSPRSLERFFLWRTGFALWVAMQTVSGLAAEVPYIVAAGHREWDGHRSPKLRFLAVFMWSIHICLSLRDCTVGSQTPQLKNQRCGKFPGRLLEQTKRRYKCPICQKSRPLGHGWAIPDTVIDTYIRQEPSSGHISNGP